MCLAGIIDNYAHLCVRLKIDLCMHAESAKEESIKESQVSDDEPAVCRTLLQEKTLRKLGAGVDYTEVRK